MELGRVALVLDTHPLGTVSLAFAACPAPADSVTRCSSHIPHPPMTDAFLSLIRCLHSTAQDPKAKKAQIPSLVLTPSFQLMRVEVLP